MIKKKVLEATPIERETFHYAKNGMAAGWGGAFDQLETYLKDTFV